MTLFRSFVVLVIAATIDACVHVPAGPRPDADRVTCGEHGGTIQKVCGAGYEACVAPYTDGGEPCSDSSECLGRCTVPASQGIIPAGKNKGTCQETNIPCDCYQEVLHGKVRRAGFCPA
jgi:hypothetical protein